MLLGYFLSPYSRTIALIKFGGLIFVRSPSVCYLIYILRLGCFMSFFSIFILG